jgi:CRISPR-associated endonuclease/helicase Cas3
MVKVLAFQEMFAKATGQYPFPYQIEFGTAPDLFELVDAPTGSGKTATAVLGWLWRRRFAEQSMRAATPRRLVYCLPMRVLVEQTRDVARDWLQKLSLHDEIKVHVLMGGEDGEEWDLEPERDTIVVGTQDMVLSRALNRGYGMSRYRWPIHYALLNNDCLWILDEIQLMGVGLATSAQLQAFRENFRTFGEAKTVWMSATLRPQWLATVDFRDHVPQLSTLNLRKPDYSADGLRERWIAKKSIENSKPSSDNADDLAAFIKDKHNRNSLTLVVVNTVNRSRKLYAAVKKLYRGGKPTGRDKKPRAPTETIAPLPSIHLIHSRFRPIEREAWMKWLKHAPPPEGRIIISTQVVEAGVDMSARTLLTELAPWPSLVQRFGRCNRRGEFTKEQPAQIYWIDVRAKDDKDAAPYRKDELDAARKQLKKLEDAGLQSLHEFSEALSDKEKNHLFPYDPPHVVRRKDFIDLFDTTPDLAGNDIDVSRFIREGDDLDVQVFWRGQEPPGGELDPQKARRIGPVRDELCPVPFLEFRDFVEKKKKTAFRWDALVGLWTRATRDTIYPGQAFWVRTSEGGYSSELGWDPGAPWTEDLWHNGREESLEAKTEEAGYDFDLLSGFPWRSISEHTEEVLEELEELEKLAPGVVQPTLRLAARWHDWGKAHCVFQQAVQDGQPEKQQRPPEWRGRRDVAKAPTTDAKRGIKGFWDRYCRRHFRHELASAIGVLTLLRNGRTPADWSALPQHLQNLTLYLIAAHHGKVRLSIRSMPEERKPPGQDQLFARGVWDGDELPAMDLGGGVTAPEVDKLDLSPMKLGRSPDGSASWAERILLLRDHPDLGPLKLAYLEAMVRAADMRASKKADEKALVKNA